MALFYKKTKTEDQEVGSKDGVVDAWYEGIIINLGGWVEGFIWESSLYVFTLLLNLSFFFLLAFSIKKKHFQTGTLSVCRYLKHKPTTCDSL